MSLIDTTYLATPTGILVYDGPPKSEGWFAARHEGITATDCVAIVGCSDYENARSIWARKRGLLNDDDAGEAAHWGNVLEEPIAQEWARRNGFRIRPVGVLANVGATWQRASLDRLVLGCPDGPCLLEVKNKSEWQSGKWHDDVPDDVHAQVAWQMLVSGYRHGHVAALVGGNRLVQHRVDWDADVEAWLVDECTRVWDAVIDPNGAPPPIVYNPLAKDVIERIHPNREGVTRIPTATAAAAYADYAQAEQELAEANARARDAKERKQGAEALLLDLMGGGDVLAVADSDVALVTAKTVPVAERVAAAYEYRRITVTKAGRVDLATRLNTTVTKGDQS